MLHLYHYAKCSTCRKARDWLAQHARGFTASDLIAAPIPLDTLRDLHARSGLPLTRFLNTSGESYRAGNFKQRSKELSEEQLLAELARDPKLVKRPILDGGKFVLVGFDPDAYSAKLGRG